MPNELPTPAASATTGRAGFAWKSFAPLGVALIWGVNIPVMKGAIGFVHPYAFNTLRLTLSVLLLGWMNRRASRSRPPRPIPWRGVLLVGFFAGFAYQLLFLGGMGRTSAGHTAVLIASGPFWTALCGRLTGTEYPRPLAWAGLAIAFAGTVLVVSDSSGEATLFGDALVLGAALTWGASTILSRRVLEGEDPLRLAFLYALVALPLHWIVAWPLCTGNELLAAPPSFWLGVIYAGAFSTGVAYALWNLALLTVGPARTAVYVNLVPVLATILAWAFLGEAIGRNQALGGVAVIGGLLFVQTAGARGRSST